MNDFVGHSALGFYKFEFDEVVNARKGFAYFAVRGPANHAIRLETKRGTTKYVDIEEADAIQIRCVFARDQFAEKNISPKDMIFTDKRDNKKYKVDVRGGKIWMMKNLAFSVTSEKQCYVEDKTYCEKFGRYYTYDDALKACPSGWHLPENDEWKRFRTFIEDSDGKEAAWMSLKSRDKWDGSDRYGFDVVPAGKATDDFMELGTSAHFWSSTAEDGDAYGWHLEPPGDFRMEFDVSSNMYSVRCLEDY